MGFEGGEDIEVVAESRGCSRHKTPRPECPDCYQDYQDPYDA